jgi:hypothetical protein
MNRLGAVNTRAAPLLLGVFLPLTASLLGWL